MSAPTHDLYAESRAETIARRVEKEIEERNWQPGHRLGSKEELRLRFGVALGTIGEALRLLQGRGLISTRPGPGGGIFVAPRVSRVRFRGMVLGFGTDPTLYSDCLIVRNALEPQVCRDAWRACRPADGKALRALIREMADVQNDAEAFLRANWRLHRRIASMSRNVPLKSYYLTILDFLEEGLGAAVPSADYRPDRSLAVHAQLVDAIQSGDPAELELAIEKHMPHVGAAPRPIVEAADQVELRPRPQRSRRPRRAAQGAPATELRPE